MKVEFSKQWNLTYGSLKHRRDDLHTLNTIFPSNPEKCQYSSAKACEEMKYAIMWNGEFTTPFQLPDS